MLICGVASCIFAGGIISSSEYDTSVTVSYTHLVYVAEYNENGTLLSIKSDEISDSVIIPFTCVNKSKVKVFIWKNDMKPLFNKVFTLN